MIAELRASLGSELERLAKEMTERMAVDPQIDPDRPAYGGQRGPRDTIQQRIQFLGQLVAGLATVDKNGVPADRIGFGSVVTVRDLASREEDSYTLLPGDLVDLDQGHVSLASPLGYALLGCRAGDKVVVATPKGERRYEVVRLTTLPQRLGISGFDDRQTAPELRC